MLPTRRSLSILLAAVALGGGVAACGDSGTEELEREAAKLQQQGEQLRQDALKAAEEVRAGTRSFEEVAAETQRQADALTQQAATTADKAIEDLQDDPRVSGEAQQQLEDAQAQLDQLTAP